MSTSIQNGCVKATSTSGNIVSICNGIITAAEPGESSSINTNGKQPVTTLSGPNGTMEVVGNKEIAVDSGPFNFTSIIAKLSNLPSTDKYLIILAILAAGALIGLFLLRKK